jgi:hypothetical protein
MRPIHLLLLLCLACGFFACTEDPSQVATELTPRPENKTLDAASFAEFTNNIVALGLFDEEAFADPEDFGSEDVRLFYDADEDEATVDFLTNDGFDEETSVAEVLANRPARNWYDSIQLTFDDAEAPRLQRWLTDNFSGATHLDLRVSFLENGTIKISGLRASEKDLVAFPAVDFFG